MEMDIIFDTKGDEKLKKKDSCVESDNDGRGTNALDFLSMILPEQEEAPKKSKRNPKNDFDLDEFEMDMGWKRDRRFVKKTPNVENLTKELTPIDKIMEKSAIQPGFEQLNAVPGYNYHDKKLRAMRRREREKTKGKKWFNLPAPEMTDEIKHDLEIIQMRSVLDPKHFYKKNDLKVLPKYFQIGKVVDSPLDYYNDRLTKKERKRTIVDELMADAEFSKYNKRKYKEIIEEKKKLHYKAHRHAKKLKGKRK